MLTITLLGTAATMPLPDRALSAAFAACGGHGLLWDCGEGTQAAAHRAGVNLMRADAICLTHYHGDHIFGLPGLLQTLGAQGRTRPLALLGPEGLPDIWAAVRARARPRPDAGAPMGVRAAVGGLDIAAMAGLFLGCAHEGLAAAVDGYISIVAALCAVRLCPRVRDVLFLSHASYEIGYRLAARELGLEPCLLLGMRLGEGSGCPLLFRVMQGACAVLNHMATFPEAAIEDGYLAPIRQGDAFTVDKS